MAKCHLVVFRLSQFFKIHKIRLETRDLLAHIEGAYQVRGLLCEKKFSLCVLLGHRRFERRLRLSYSVGKLQDYYLELTC